MSTETLYPEDTIVRVTLDEVEMNDAGEWQPVDGEPRTDGLVQYALTPAGAAIEGLEQALVNVEGTKVYQAAFEGGAIATGMTAAQIVDKGRLFRITTFGTDTAPVVTPVVYRAYRNG
jgi:hypothetical protein